jgi:hypothetical protein
LLSTPLREYFRNVMTDPTDGTLGARRGSVPRARQVFALLLFGVALILMRVEPSVSAATSPSSATPITLQDDVIPPVEPSVVDSYMGDYEVSREEAMRRLGMQARAPDIAEALRAALGREYAGVWYDHEIGEFVVPVTVEADRSMVQEEFARRQLGDSYRVEQANSTWAELMRAYARINTEHRSLLNRGIIQTGIDARGNAVGIATATSIAEAEREQVGRTAASETVRVKILKQAEDNLAVPTVACVFPSCDRPLRGGVRLLGQTGVLGCTTGFLVFGNVNNQRYMMSAGHCFDGGQDFPRYAWNSAGARHMIGGIWSWIYGTSGDAGLVRVVGDSWWNMPPGEFWPGVVVWGPDFAGQAPSQPFHTIFNGAQPSYKGLYACHSGSPAQGSWPSTTCGTVSVSETSTSFDDNGDGIGDTTVGNLRRLTGASVCVLGGDSGGPVWANYTGYGIVNAGFPGCDTTIWYTDAQIAAANMGTHFKQQPWP